LHDAIEDAVRREIEGLHEFLVGWFAGSLPAEAFETRFLRRFAPDLVFIPPAGTLLGLSEFASSVHGARWSNPEFRVAIRNSRVRWESGAHVVATYEEWQRNARASTPPANGRIATVVFATSEPLTWLHIHETWLPPGVMSAGPYDF
jgi:hypothetical protein